MVREDWAQHATTVVLQSAVIRDWIGEAPYLFFVGSVKEFNASDRNIDFETVEFIAPDASTRRVFGISELAALDRDGKVLDHAIEVLHPFEQSDLQSLARAVKEDLASRVFVLVWWPSHVSRTWLDAHGALNLHTGQASAPPDPLMVAAAEAMIDEEYNGLSSGRGKDAVVQLVRAFEAEGYPLDVDAWLRAYFAAGGSFRHAESVAKLVREMKAGTRHRVKTRYAFGIVDDLRARLDGAA